MELLSERVCMLLEPLGQSWDNRIKWTPNGVALNGITWALNGVAPNARKVHLGFSVAHDPHY